MPTTPNYGWVLPELGGDDGVWGSKLNQAFMDVDYDLRAIDLRLTAVEEAVDGLFGSESEGAGGENPIDPDVGKIRLAALDGFELRGTGNRVWQSEQRALRTNIVNGDDIPWYIPLRHLQPGHRIIKFSSNGANGGRTMPVQLVYWEEDGTEVLVEAGHVVASSGETETALSHDVLLGKRYFIKITPGTTGFVGVVNTVSVTTILP